QRLDVTSVTITAPDTDPTAPLLGGWLKARLDVTPTFEKGTGKIMESVKLELADGGTMELHRNLNDGTATLKRTGQMDRVLPLVRRPLGEELAEELRRLDPDQPYASALAAATGETGLDQRPASRVHIWHDPALAEQ